MRGRVRESPGFLERIFSDPDRKRRGCSSLLKLVDYYSTTLLVSVTPLARRQ